MSIFTMDLKAMDMHRTDESPAFIRREDAEVTMYTGGGENNQHANMVAT